MSVTGGGRSFEIVDSVGAIAWECDAATRQLTYVSGTVVRVFGYPAATWLKPGFLGDVVHPDDQTRCARIIRAAAASHQGFDFEGRMFTDRGDVKVVRATAQFVPPNDARPAVFQGLLIDLTRRRAEQPSWIDNDRLLRLVLAQTPVMTWVVDADLRYTWSSSLSMGRAQSDEEVKGRPMADVIPLDAPWRDRVLAHHRRSLEGVVVTYEIELGGLRYHAHLEPCRDDTGQVVGVAGIAVDMTEWMKAEDERAELAAIVEATPDLVGRTDGDGWLLYLNRAGRRILGIPQDADLRGLHVSKLHPGDIFPLYAEEVARTMRTDNVWTGETQVRATDGRVIDVSAVVQAHRDGTGRLMSYSTVMRDISERMAREEILRRAAEHDSLTGLLNRAMFESHLGKAIAAAGRGRPAALLYLDLDRFKAVNDSIGHLAADRFLVGLTRRLEAQTRAEDVLARVGGDEFAVLLHGVTEGQALQIANGVRETVSSFRFQEGGKVFTAGVSIGVAMIDGTAGAAELLTRADWACYAAKASGRNRVEPFDAEHVPPLAESTLPAQLEASLRTDRFRLLYQPVVSTATGETVYHEALIRMVDHDGSLIEPGGFLDTAERFGMAGRIDRWVVRHALDRIEAAARRGIDLTLAVNLSGTSLADPSTADAIVSDVRAAGAASRQLVFEVSEAVVVAAISDAQRLAESLKAVGCRLAVDSFGAGLSSFAYLRHLSADLLKIDESFMWGIESDSVGQALVRSMIELGHGLGICTVAKGIEHSSVRRMLTDLGVDLVQGFDIGRPGEQPVAAAL